MKMQLQQSVSSTIPLIKLLRMVQRLLAMAIVAMYTSLSTVLVAAQPLPELISPRWSCSCSCSSSSSTGASSSLCSLLTWPCLAAPHICTNRLRPNHNQHYRHQSHHRHYRRRCHHPFLFFNLHFSPSSLLLYTTFILLISLASSISLPDTDMIGELKSDNVNGKQNSDNHYELRNTLTGHTLNSSRNPYVGEEHVCGSIDIRNSVPQFKKLENCTVIEGHLQIVLFDNGTGQDFENITFPMLREITDYFLLFRVKGLESLTKVFPNLSVIRGRTLLHNYAFIIYEMLNLQEIGLRSLTNIIRGDVRIEKNPNLCFVDTIDWSRITRNYLISGNKDSNACSNCGQNCPVVSASRENGKNIGDVYNRVCWTSEICQKHSCSGDCERLNRTCSSTGQCCPEQCIGDCVTTSIKPLNQTCAACKKFVYQSTCFDECPPNTYVYFNRRCVTKEECHKLSNNDVFYKAFFNKCDSICPVGYTENAQFKNECDHCGGDCPKVCQSSVVSNIASAQSLKGCTKINGSLEIYISSGGAQIVKELEENLKDLTEISDYLKIARSFPLITLNFLRNLKIIHGNKLERQAYSLLILDNPNLQDLWTFELTSKRKPIQVLNGRIFFHINPKLCYNKIQKMLDYVNFESWNLSFDERDVSKHTNGDKVACEVTKLSVTLWGIQSVVIGISFENFKKQMEDPRSLLGYLIYYRESEHRNVSIFDGRDACSTNEWNVIEFDDIEGGDSKKNGTTESDKLTTIVPNLKPYTQYALYIKTYTIASETKGAQSDIIYFQTKPATPSQPRNLHASAKMHDEIKITWDVPSKPNGEITHYIVRVTKDEFMINHRDYCSENSIVKEPPRAVSIATTESTAGFWLMNGTSSSSSAKKDNEMDPNKQCCTCSKNEKIRPSDVEQSINFEDYIINTVYIKRHNMDMNSTDTQEVLRRRRKRYTSSETSTESSFTTQLMETIGPSVSSATGEVVFNASGKTIFSTEVYYRREMTILGLAHYTEYTLEVQACQDAETNTNSDPCSMTAITSIRTLPLATADDIEQNSITHTFDNSTNDDDSKYNSIHLKWEEPEKANGFILSYQIEHRRITADMAKIPYFPICVARSQYLQNNNGYSLELPPGNYSIRIRARSLASFGNWTEPVHILIEEPGKKKIFALIGGITLFFLVVILIILYKLRQSRSKLDYISVNPDYMSSGFNYEPDPKWEIPRENVSLIHELGQGSFGMVYQGELNDNKQIVPCAVKTVNESSSIRDRMDFLKEADVMKSFTDCHHVVKLLGIVSITPPVYVLMEIMTRGDLRKYLRDNRPDTEEPNSQPPTLDQLLKMAIEIADGMAYLASKKFVHRDLAARNCMVAEDMTVKIGDFGMTRDIYETDYYRKGGKGLLPVRWMSPESLKDGIFTTYSDVWSYGVVLWEMATLASQPYQGLSNEEVLKFVVEGGRMSKPENCPDVLWNLMVHSWERKPKARPTFLKIVEMLLDRIDKKPFLYLSFYNRWKNEHPSQGAEKGVAERDDSLIPLKPLSAASDSDEEDSTSESSNGQLCEEDMNVNFFPLSRPGRELIFDEDTKPEQATDDATEVTTSQAMPPQDSSNQQSGSSLQINEPSSHSVNFNLLNNNLSASLANSESSSASNVNLEAGTNKDPIINFAGFDTAKLTQSKDSSLNVVPNRNLINGHLINTSMV